MHPEQVFVIGSHDICLLCLVLQARLVKHAVDMLKSRRALGMLSGFVQQKLLVCVQQSHPSFLLHDRGTGLAEV